MTLYPDEYRDLHSWTTSQVTRRAVEANNLYLEAVHRLFPEVSQDQNDCIRQRLLEMQVKVRPAPMLGDSLGLDGDQYVAYQRIISNFSSFTTRKSRGTGFFVTGPGGTGKSFLLHTLVAWCNDRRLKTLKMAPTGIAAENVGGKTIHSSLHINSQGSSDHGSLLSGIFRMEETVKDLKKIKVLIIDEISMVSNEMLSFVSELFARIHKNAFAFGGLHVIVFGDLLQLPPVRGRQVFHSPVWKIFIPLFLRRSRRHDSDPEFGRLLEAVRFGKITDEIMNILHRKEQEFRIENLTHMCTSLHSRKDEVLRLNALLLQRVCSPNVVVHKAEDRERGEKLTGPVLKQLARESNLPNEVVVVPGARVMFLKNNFISRGLANGSCGLITKVDDKGFPTVAFPLAGRIEVRLSSSTKYGY